MKLYQIGIFFYLILLSEIQVSDGVDSSVKEQKKLERLAKEEKKKSERLQKDEKIRNYRFKKDEEFRAKLREVAEEKAEKCKIVQLKSHELQMRERAARRLIEEEEREERG